MKTSASGRALIEQREGRSLAAYRDTMGIWTIGVGHTGRMAPPPVTPGMTITGAECDALLAADLAPVEAAINGLVTVPLAQNEFDALASLGFNIGVAGLTRSTVVRRLNQGDIEGAAAAFLLWNHPAVLADRRTEEQAQFLAPDARDGAGPSRASVAAARAATLAARADAIKGRAKTTQTAGAAMALVGAAAAAATAQAHHGVAFALFALVLLGAVIDGAVAWWHHTQAATLAGHAATQAAAAAQGKSAAPLIPSAAVFATARTPAPAGPATSTKP